MSFFNDVIPGMASYMEEVDASAEVSVSEAPEAVGATEETVNESAEVQETAADEEADAAEAEMVFRSIDEMERMRSFVRTNGIDRTFLYFYAPRLRAMNLSVPEMESFDTIGNPNSSLSRAYLEGCAGLGKDIWEFIKKVWQKIKNFFAKIWESVRTRFGNLDKNIGRLRQEYQERSDDPDKLERADAKAKVMSIKQIFNAVSKATEAMRKVDKFQSIMKDMAKLTVSQDANSGFSSESANESRKAQVEDLERLAKEVKAAQNDTEAVKLSSIGWGDVDRLLSSAADMARSLATYQRTFDNLKAIAANGLAEAEKAASRGDAGGESAVAGAKFATRLINRMASAVSKIISTWEWIARQMIRTAAMRIACGSKK